jgi:hypothetical protein
VVLAWSGHRIEQAQVSEVVRLDRRRFLLTLGGASAIITVAGGYVGGLRAERRTSEGVAGGGRWSASHPLPNAGAEVSPAPGTRPEFTPLEQHYRIDINTTPLEIDEKTWRLRVDGLVDAPLALTLADLRSQYAPLHQFVTIACISNPVPLTLEVPSEYNGIAVTSIGNKVLANVDKITTFIIPSSITSVGINMCGSDCSCPTLKNIVCMGETPFTLGSFSLDPAQLNGGCTIYVPDKSLDLYKNADWKVVINSYKKLMKPLSEFK